MQDQPSEAGDHGVPPTEAQNLRDQGVVLIHVLQRHPTLLTIPDLVREITAGSEDFAEGDAMERAVRDLTGVGLLMCPSGPRCAHSGRSALPEDPLRRQLLGGAGDFGGSGSQGGPIRRVCSGPPESPAQKGH